LDFAAKAGTVVRSAAAGQVTYAKNCGCAYGNLVKIQHANGVETWYAHLRSISKRALGATVIPGQVVGEVGSTGNSTGPHLHFETRVNGVPKDPDAFLSGHGVPP
jgi:murein DD-endopeptidase MepM/ murein hydrolase activator NlpD